METPDKARFASRDRGAAQCRFRHAAQNGTRFKTDELLISGIFYSVVLDHSGPPVTKIAGSEATHRETTVSTL